MIVVSVIGIILAFAVLIFAAYKKISMFLAAVLAAAIVALFGGLDVAASLVGADGPFLIGMKDFVGSWLVIFALGALLGALYDKSGATWRISSTLINKAGTQWTLLIYVLVGALLVYGGIQVTVMIFVLLPFAKILFPKAGIPWYLFPGITGLAMTAQAFTGINYALIYYGLMLLILVLTFVMLGYREVSNILFLSFLYPLVLWVLNHWTVEIILKEKLIAVMFFGVIYGVGAGITYRLGYSYGGTDTLAKILKTKVLKAVELKHILLALDGIIMAVMLLRFSLDVVAYALVGQIIYVNSMNYVIFNMGPKLYEIQIVCENSKAIESFVIHEIHKSATLSQVTGSYSGQTKTQVDCVCNSREYVQLREFIRDQGVDCFIKVFPLTHVFGQNKDFHRLSDENL